jgi:hypothetical protein
MVSVESVPAGASPRCTARSTMTVIVAVAGEEPGQHLSRGRALHRRRDDAC